MTTRSLRTSKAGTRRPAPLTVSREALLIDDSDKEFRELVHSALAFSSRLEAVRDEFGSYIGLTGIQYSILIATAHLQEERDIGISEVAEHLSLSGTFVTTEVGKLVKSGLLFKNPNGRDKRRIILALTAKAWARLSELSKVQAEVNNAHFEPLSRQDFLNLRRMMRDLIHSTDRALMLLSHINKLRKSGSSPGSS